VTIRNVLLRGKRTVPVLLDIVEHEGDKLDFRPFAFVARRVRLTMDNLWRRTVC
jgi:hypothetical protein